MSCALCFIAMCRELQRRSTGYGPIGLEGRLTCSVSTLTLGIDGIVDILQAHFATISGIFRIRGLRKRHEIRRYSPDDIIDP
jgi:hypothetical protein